jgi:hypothetical protein
MIKPLICVFLFHLILSCKAHDESCKLNEFIHDLIGYESALYRILQDFGAFRDLDTHFCEPNYLVDDIFMLCIYPSQKLILNKELDTEGVVRVLSTNHDLPVIVKINNLLGIDLNYQGMHNLFIDHLELSNTIFDFYQDGRLIGSRSCEKLNFNITSGFSLNVKLKLQRTVKFKTLCPYAFINFYLNSLEIDGMIDHFVKSNVLEFFETEYDASLNSTITALS